MTAQSDEMLFNYTKETYDGSFKADLLDQYKLYVQSVDNVSARRIASTRYLLPLNAALVALYSIQSTNVNLDWWTIFVPIMGIVISFLWYRIIKSHKDLNAVKFKIIPELEQQLPASIYRYEWQLANEGRGKLYKSVSEIERWIPLAFLFLHIVLFIFLIGESFNDWFS